MPDWVDDELARQAVEAAGEKVQAIQSRLQALNEALGQKSQKVRDAKLAVEVAQARLDVLKGQADTLQVAFDSADDRVSKEQRGAVAAAQAQLDRIGQALEANQLQARTQETSHLEELGRIKERHERQRHDAKREQDTAIAALDNRVKDLHRDLASLVERLAQQLREHLSAKGVDVVALAKLKDDANKVRGQVRELEEKQPLVERWKTWQEVGGAAKVEALKVAAELARSASVEHSGKLTLFDSQADEATRAYDKAVGAKRIRASDVDDDLAVLDSLVGEFKDYLAMGESIIDLTTTARSLRNKVTADRQKLDALESSIVGQYGTLRQRLTARDTSVRDLVEASLPADAERSASARAQDLCACYKLIGPQVVNDVNVTLKTLLVNIGAFQKAFVAFEREVASFNRRLQAGLSAVRCFERINDLRLDIVTNFENLGFYKKLARMDDIARQHASEYGRDNTRELPSDDIARALGDFASVMGNEGNVEVNLSSHITLKGSVTDNGLRKEFKRASELENISSEGLTSLVLITLMTALLNTIRGSEPVHVPWVTDEVGKFDPRNFLALMKMLRDNHIDVVTASPELGPAQQGEFAQRYLFEDRGRIREYRPLGATPNAQIAVAATTEALS